MSTNASPGVQKSKWPPKQEVTLYRLWGGVSCKVSRSRDKVTSGFDGKFDFWTPGLYFLTYRFYIPSLVVVRSVGAEIRSLPALVAIFIFDPWAFIC